jgi:biopolymer transport protein ExbD
MAKKDAKDQYFIEINGEDTYYLGDEYDVDQVKETIADYINPFIDDLHKEKKKEINVLIFIKEMTDEEVEDICSEC